MNDDYRIRRAAMDVAISRACCLWVLLWVALVALIVGWLIWDLTAN